MNEYCCQLSSVFRDSVRSDIHPDNVFSGVRLLDVSDFHQDFLFPILYRGIFQFLFFNFLNHDFPHFHTNGLALCVNSSSSTLCCPCVIFQSYCLFCSYDNFCKLAEWVYSSFQMRRIAFGSDVPGIKGSFSNALSQTKANSI